jgi:hypothetical protein
MPKHPIENAAEILADRMRHIFVSTKPNSAIRTGFKLKGRKRTTIEEVEFLTEDGETCGYALLNETRRAVRVIALSASPTNFSTVLEKDLVLLLRKLKIEYLSFQWYYFGPFETVAEVKIRGRGFLYARVPNYAWIYRDAPIDFEESEDIEDDQVFEIISPSAVILSKCTPVKYRQVCSKILTTPPSLHEPGSIVSRLSHLKGFNGCLPHCIAGCTPVAWAVTASGFKRALGNQGQLIFNGAQNWREDWDYEALDRVVDSEIWKVHHACATSCDGSTLSENASKGCVIFGEASPIVWNRWVTPTFSAILSLIKNNMPFVLSAQSKWEKYGILMGAEPGDVGHSVFCYGADEESQMVFVSLGWGFWYKDVWIPFSELRQLDVVYRPFPLP